MRICFVTEGRLSDFRKREAAERKKEGCEEEIKTKADIFLFGFGGMGEVSYEKE